MRSTIKIVKRGQRNEVKIEEPELKQTPEQSAREMVLVVKRWVTEWQECRRQGTARVSKLALIGATPPMIVKSEFGVVCQRS